MHVRLVTTLAAALLAVACRGPSTSARHAGNEHAPPRDVEQVVGRVTYVAEKTPRIDLDVNGTRRSIPVAEDAEIRIDDFHGSYDDLAEGTRVRASLDKTGEEPEAIKIEILDKGVRTQGAGTP